MRFILYFSIILFSLHCYSQNSIDLSKTNCPWLSINESIDENGVLHTQYSFQGAPDVYIRIFEDASLKYIIMEGEILNEKRQGEWLFYENRTLIEKITYFDDLRHGLYEKYYSSGQIMIRSSYKENHMSGAYFYFREDGSILREEIINYNNAQ